MPRPARSTAPLRSAAVTAAVIGLAVCVVLLAALVAALLRRVTQLRARIEPLAASARPAPPRPREPLVGACAPLVSGVDPQGRPAAAGPEPGQRLLLAFLTGSCEPCRALWAPLSEGHRPGLPAVAVTPSPTTESSRAVAALASDGVPVVMSSEAWLAYRVRGAPWLVVVRDGAVVAEGRAESWEELVALVTPAP